MSLSTRNRTVTHHSEVKNRNAQRQGLEIDLEIFIAAPPERVWQIISTASRMRRWQGATVFEPRLGGRVERPIDYELVLVQHAVLRLFMA
jgi:hypothetical protein